MLSQLVFLLPLLAGIVCQSNVTTTPSSGGNSTASVASITNATTTVAVANTTQSTSAMTKSANATTASKSTNNTSMTTDPVEKTTKLPPTPLPCNHTDCPMYSTCNVISKSCECAIIVPALVSKICGTDGKTYKNIQNLEETACKGNLAIKEAHKGECEKEKKSSSKKTVIIVIVVLIVIILLVVVGVLLYRKKKQQGGANVNEEKSKDNLL